MRLPFGSICIGHSHSNLYNIWPAMVSHCEPTWLSNMNFTHHVCLIRCRFVAATVLSINHVNSLKLESECAAPGEKPHFLGVREQRVSHILIFLTIGCSVFLTPLLSHIPMPVCVLWCFHFELFSFKIQF